MPFGVWDREETSCPTFFSHSPVEVSNTDTSEYWEVCCPLCLQCAAQQQAFLMHSCCSFLKSFFLFHTSLLGSGHFTATHLDAPRGKQALQHSLTRVIGALINFPKFMGTSFIQEKQVAWSQLVTLSPSLPCNFVLKSWGHAAKYSSHHHSRLAVFMRLGRR